MVATSHGSDLLEIEVDGELPTARGSDGPRRGGRRRPAVAWVVVGTVAAAIVGALASTAFDADRTPQSEVPSATPSEADDVLAAAVAAMSAWGEFAGTGDVRRLDGHFDPSGPQYRQLAGEVEGIKATGATSGFQVESSGVVERLSEDTATVRAAVVWRRGAEPEQPWEWIIDLRRRAGPWTVWTVRAT